MPITDLNQGYDSSKSKINSIKNFTEVSKSAKKLKSTAGNSLSPGIPDVASQLNKVADQQKRYLRNQPTTFDQLFELLNLANGSGSETSKYLKKKLLETVTKIEPDIKKIISESILKPSISVDAACAGNPGVLEYQGVNTATKEVLFSRGPFSKGTVNIGEFLAIVHGLAYLKKINSTCPIYSDSRTAISWVKKKAIKTNLERTSTTEELFKMVDSALDWLHNNPYTTKILKWETEDWGENPADYGRK